MNVSSGLLLDNYWNKAVLLNKGVPFNNHQQWKQHALENGYFAIRSRTTGKALRMTNQPLLHASASNHDAISQWKFSTIRDDIVAITSRASGQALATLTGNQLGWSRDSGAAKSQWKRIPLADGYVAYKHVATGLFVDYFYNQTVLLNGSDDVANPHQQWKERDAGNGFVTIESRTTREYLGCSTEPKVHTLSNDTTDTKSQWQIQSI
jgi:hypothetical protein